MLVCGGLEKQLRIKLQINSSGFVHPAPVGEGEKQRLRFEITIYGKQTEMEWEIHSNSSNISNKNTQKRIGFTHRRCSHLNSVPHGHRDKDKMVDALLRRCFLSLSLSQQKQGGIICVVSPIFQTAGLSCGQQYSAQLISSPLGSGSAPLCLTWPQLGLAFLRHSVPMAAHCTSVVERVHFPGLSCVWHLELCSSQGTGRDGQQRDMDKIHCVGPGKFPKTDTEWNHTASRVHSLFNSPQSHAPQWWNAWYGIAT